MRRIVILLAAALLLSGCAADRTDIRAETLQQTYAAMSGCNARAEETVVLDGETRRYVVDVAKDGGTTRVTVVEPEALAGVSASVTDGVLALEYDGMVLDAGGTGTEISAMNAADIVLRAVAEGWITERNTERFEGTDALRLCFETEQGGETLLVTAYFDAADTPLYAELERDGRVLAYLRFTDFAFCDILTDT